MQSSRRIINHNGREHRSTFTLALVFVLAVGLSVRAAAQEAPYNVILFITDDMPFGGLPYYNPSIDFTNEVPHKDTARRLRSATHNRLDARLLATPDLQDGQTDFPFGTFQPPLAYTPLPGGGGGTSPWASYTVCPLDGRDANGECVNPPFDYQDDPSTPTKDVLPGHGGLDRLADNGLVFTRFYATAAVCLPTRVSMMTGKHGQRTGSNANDPDHRLQSVEEMVISKLLKQEAQYRTAFIGKWQVTSETLLPSELDPFFDEIIYDNTTFRDYFSTDEMLCHGGLCDTDPVWKWWKGVGEPSVTSGSEADCNANPSTVENVHTVGCNFTVRGYADLAVAFLQDHVATHPPGENFFLTVSFNAVHDKHKAPNRTKDHYAETPFPNRNKVYWALVEETDAAIGRILNFLEEKGLDSDTVVLFTSDQGPDGTSPTFGDPRLRGGKASTWEGGIRVPFIALPPGGLQGSGAGPVYLNNLGSHVDIYRTVAELANVHAHPEVAKRDGVSLAASILSQTESTRTAVYSRHGSQQLSMVINGGIFTLLSFLEGQSGGNPGVPAELVGVCGYGPDPATLDAEGGCPDPEDLNGKLPNCTTAGRGTSYQLCRTDNDCLETECTVHEKRCIPEDPLVLKLTPEQLQSRPRCTAIGQCQSEEVCKEVQVDCNQCVPARWKIKTTPLVGAGAIFDVASNPGEDSDFDFSKSAAEQFYAGDSHMLCALEYLRASMLCLADYFAQCQLDQEDPCEEGLAWEPLTSTCDPPESICP